MVFPDGLPAPRRYWAYATVALAVTLADAVPLFHSFLSLAPALEAALFQVLLSAPGVNSRLLLRPVLST